MSEGVETFNAMLDLAAVFSATMLVQGLKNAIEEYAPGAFSRLHPFRRRKAINVLSLLVAELSGPLIEPILEAKKNAIK